MVHIWNKYRSPYERCGVLLDTSIKTVQGLDTSISSALSKGLDESGNQSFTHYSGDELVDAVAAEPLDYETMYQQAYFNGLYDDLRSKKTEASEDSGTESKESSKPGGVINTLTESPNNAAPSE